MKVRNAIIFLSGVTLLSCGGKTEHNTDNIPNALQDEPQRNTYSSISKVRDKSDIIESLYQEQVAQSPELQEIESTMAAMHKAKLDSGRVFFEYSSNNNKYYEHVNSMAQQIKDSVLAQKMLQFIQQSETQYSSLSKGLQELDKEINSGRGTLEDLYYALKIKTTLPVMEQYQKSELPSERPMRQYKEHQNKTIQRLERKISK
ncbi:hypothetical protein [Edaphocola flava]|uniref:hypothetical protein n=1 Tax=Edaphocola flava TaxID=2499629 RepID=UPI00100AAA66|nr:hypothetical protein [Edaphocola flava]